MTEFHLTKTDNNTNYSIKQGATFFIRAKYKGADLSTWTPRGQIRKKYADSDETVIATFGFIENSYDVVNDWTLIVATLSAEETRLLPVPTKRRSNSRDTVLVGTNVWVYDLEIESTSGEVIRFLEGYVEIDPEVTR